MHANNSAAVAALTSASAACTDTAIHTTLNSTQLTFSNHHAVRVVRAIRSLLRVMNANKWGARASATTKMLRVRTAKKRQQSSKHAQTIPMPSLRRLRLLAGPRCSPHNPTDPQAHTHRTRRHGCARTGKGLGQPSRSSKNNNRSVAVGRVQWLFIDIMRFNCVVASSSDRFR